MRFKTVTMQNTPCKVLAETILSIFDPEVSQNDFREWARNNPETEVNSAYHPFVQDELIKIQKLEEKDA